MSWIQTYTGKKVHPFNLKIEDIDIEDIAHSLALQCRFNGHVKEFYSVAEHCCRVSDICPPYLKAWGLLHDASEAYLCDLPTPLKNEFPEYRDLERVLLRVLSTRYILFNLFPMERMREIKEYDLILLATEGRDLLNKCETDWLKDFPEPLPEIIIPWSWRMAEKEYLKRAEQLGLM